MNYTTLVHYNVNNVLTRSKTWEIFSVNITKLRQFFKSVLH